MKTDYTQLTKEQLQEKLKEFEMRVMRSYGIVGKKEIPENRPRLKKEVARIKTELNKK